MDRPSIRDMFAPTTALPTSLLLFACLGLPQVKDCHGHVQTAAQAGTSPFIIGLAIVALFPLAWHIRFLRSTIVALAGAACVLSVMSSVLVIPVAIYCLIRKPWRTDEMFVAFASACCALAFLVVLPVITLFSSWMEGACLAWGTAWGVLVQSAAWGSATRARFAIANAPVPVPVFELAPRAPAAPRAALPARVGDYAIERELGGGRMGRVYLGRHVEQDTQHAVKVLAPSYRAVPEARQRFFDEAKTQAKLLGHPNIAQVTNVVVTPEQVALVMEHVAGPSLASVIGSLPGDPDEITRIMLGVLAAVEHAHRAGVLHRDLKPTNILLDGPERTPRVTDFRLSAGTVSYMSPEHLRGPEHVTPQSDVFSLGIVLYEMTTGRLPFRGDSDDEVRYAIATGRCFLPRVIDPRIRRVIDTALQPDPARRYASCAMMALALSADRR